MTIKKIHDELFRIKIPLIGNPLGYLNVYLIRSSNRNLLIDTGLGQTSCHRALLEALRELEVEPSLCDIFITHHHVDHVGLVGDLVTGSNALFIHEAGWKILQDWDGFGYLMPFIEKNGFPPDLLEQFLDDEPINQLRFKWDIVPTFLCGGESIEIGGYNLNVIPTPGHSPDHLCLYEPTHRILFAGDHILMGVSPIVQCWNDNANPLHDYFRSLKETAQLSVSMVLPAHRETMFDHLKRIDELLQHHRRRLRQILDLLSIKPKTAYQVAKEMTWHLKADAWENFPIEQRLFATSEVIAHMKFLEKYALLRTQIKEDLIYFNSRI